MAESLLTVREAMEQLILEQVVDKVLVLEEANRLGFDEEETRKLEAMLGSSKDDQATFQDSLCYDVPMSRIGRLNYELKMDGYPVPKFEVKTLDKEYYGGFFYKEGSKLYFPGYENLLSVNGYVELDLTNSSHGHHRKISQMEAQTLVKDAMNIIHLLLQNPYSRSEDMVHEGHQAADITLVFDHCTTELGDVFSMFDGYGVSRIPGYNRVNDGSDTGQDQVLLTKCLSEEYHRKQRPGALFQDFEKVPS